MEIAVVRGEIESLLKEIEKENGMKRVILNVREEDEWYVVSTTVGSAVVSKKNIDEWILRRDLEARGEIKEAFRSAARFYKDSDRVYG